MYVFRYDEKFGNNLKITLYISTNSMKLYYYKAIMVIKCFFLLLPNYLGNLLKKMIGDPFQCKIDQLYNPSYASLTYHIIYWGLCGKIMNYSAMQQQRMTIENTFANKEKSFLHCFAKLKMR